MKALPLKTGVTMQTRGIELTDRPFAIVVDLRFFIAFDDRLAGIRG
jgi:hypothetical protein